MLLCSPCHVGRACQAGGGARVDRCHRALGNQTASPEKTIESNDKEKVNGSIERKGGGLEGWGAGAMWRSGASGGSLR